MSTVKPVAEPRAVVLIKEELDDLSKYLDGVPVELREAGHLDAYEERRRKLERELSLAKLKVRLDALGRTTISLDPNADEEAQLRLLNESVVQMHEIHRGKAKGKLRELQMISAVALAVSVSMMISHRIWQSADSFSSWAALLIGVLVLASLSLLWISRRLSKEERLIHTLSDIRSDLARISDVT